jgi:hypothetical protein
MTTKTRSAANYIEQSAAAAQRAIYLKFKPGFDVIKGRTHLRGLMDKRLPRVPGERLQN